MLLTSALAFAVLGNGSLPTVTIELLEESAKPVDSTPAADVMLRASVYNLNLYNESTSTCAWIKPYQVTVAYHPPTGTSMQAERFVFDVDDGHELTKSAVIKTSPVTVDFNGKQQWVSRHEAGIEYYVGPEAWEELIDIWPMPQRVMRADEVTLSLDMVGFYVPGACGNEPALSTIPPQTLGYYAVTAAFKCPTNKPGYYGTCAVQAKGEKDVKNRALELSELKDFEFSTIRFAAIAPPENDNKQDATADDDLAATEGCTVAGTSPNGLFVVLLGMSIGFTTRRRRLFSAGPLI